jgi:serine/threonine protein phosphatase PrpC
VRLFTNLDMSGVEQVSLLGGTAAIFSAASPTRSDANEDSVAVIALDTERAVLAIADGMGGRPDGQSASRVALERLAHALERVDPRDESLRGAILDATEEANRELLASGIGAATTLGVVELQGDHLRPYHVGDSAILVLGQRGRIKLQTVPHSPTGYAVEAGLLDEEEALHHEERHLISNAVGTQDMRIEVGSPLRLSPRDTLLLGTDGLFDNLAMAEIVEIVRCGPLAAAALQLAEACRERMASSDASLPSKPDDLSFVLFRKT